MIDPITEPIATELAEAAKRMTQRERALSDALLTLAGWSSDIAELLEEIAEQCDGGEAIPPLALLLRLAADRAISTHAAVVGDILGPTVQ